jgi:hypothetical protein
MKILIVLWLCGLPIILPAQIQKTLTSPEGLFRLRYSDFLVNCMSRPEGSSYPDSCQSLGPVCTVPGSDGITMACFAYPKEKFRDNHQFVAASVFVSKIKSAKNQKTCLKGSRNWFVISSEPKTTTINHVEFREFEVGDNWAGGGQSGPVYRTFHNGACYELGIQEVMSRAAYDPERDKLLTDEDRAEVRKPLAQVLDSFVFLK